jgi:hypothetical protein
MTDNWANPPQWIINAFPDSCSFSTPKFFPNQTRFASVRIWCGEENTPSFKAWIAVVECKKNKYYKPKKF